MNYNDSRSEVNSIYGGSVSVLWPAAGYDLRAGDGSNISAA